MSTTAHGRTLVVAHVGGGRLGVWQLAIERLADDHRVHAVNVRCDQIKTSAGHERNISRLADEMVHHGGTDLVAIGGAAGAAVTCVGEHQDLITRLVLCNPRLRLPSEADRERLHATASTIDRPTLILLGLGVGPAVRDAKALARHLPGSQLRLVPYLGGAWMSQAPLYFADQVGQFLGSAHG